MILPKTGMLFGNFQNAIVTIKNFESFFRTLMYKLGTQVGGVSRVVQSQNAPTDARASFEHEYSDTCVQQFLRGRPAGCTGTYDYDRGRSFHSAYYAMSAPFRQRGSCQNLRLRWGFPHQDSLIPSDDGSP